MNKRFFKGLQLARRMKIDGYLIPQLRALAIIAFWQGYTEGYNVNQTTT